MSIIDKNITNIIAIIGIIFWSLFFFFLLGYPILGILEIIKNFSVFSWIGYTFISFALGIFSLVIHNLCEDKLNKEEITQANEGDNNGKSI